MYPKTLCTQQKRYPMYLFYVINFKCLEPDSNPLPPFFQKEELKPLIQRLTLQHRDEISTITILYKSPYSQLQHKDIFVQAVMGPTTQLTVSNYLTVPGAPRLADNIWFLDCSREQNHIGILVIGCTMYPKTLCTQQKRYPICLFLSDKF